MPWDTDGFKPATKDFIDGLTYDGRKPNEYLEKFPIGLKSDQVVSGNTVSGG